MKKHRGFKLGRRLTTVWRWVFCRQRYRSKHYLKLRAARGGYYPQSQPLSVSSRRSMACSTMRAKLLDWTRLLGRSLRREGGRIKGFQSLGDDREFRSPLLVQEADECGWKKPPPKGYLAVYISGKKCIGDEGSPKQRYLVPVMYFNHPLFGELLREAEDEFGFHHPGGITIPCAAAQFELIRTRIAGVRSAEISPKSAKFQSS